MIHEQVQKQLEYLKYLVDAEKKEEERCKKWGLSYIPSRRKFENISNHEDYKKEIEKNGDKNLIVKVKMNGDDGINMYGIYQFARRYANREYLVYRTEYGSEILINESKAEIVKEESK